MDSDLQLEVTAILLNDYMTRTLVAFAHPVRLSYPSY